MSLVVDASVAAAWAFADEESAIADKALHRLLDEEAFAPSLWWFEIRNTLLVGERRGRISMAGVGDFLRKVSRLPILMDRDPREIDLLQLARRHSLTVYDAAYLELATRLGAPIATLDRSLSEACVAEGVSLI